MSHMKIVKLLSAVGLALSFILLATTFVASCSSYKESTTEFDAPITVKAHVEQANKIIIADVGSGVIQITKSGTLTYLKGGEFIEVATLASPEPLGKRTYLYNGKSATYDPQSETLTFYGGLPSPEDDFHYNE